MEQEILIGLMRRGIPEHIARGIVGNMMVESGLNPGINEISPIVEGSRGGYGLNQWTGPRRKQFEAFAAERGAAPDDLNAQLDFTLWELQNTESKAANALYGATNATEAAQIYSNQFLRPGIPHLDRRIAAANQLGVVQPQSQNQLQQFAMKSQTQDAAPFMRQRNALATVGF